MKISMCILALFFLINCENCDKSTNETQELDAKITLINWKQDIYVTTREGEILYNAVKVDYKIENTGSIIIKNYEIYFKAETIDGKTYESAHGGSDLKINEIDINTATIFTDTKKAINAEITGQFLE